MKIGFKYLVFALLQTLCAAQFALADRANPMPPNTVEEANEIRALPGKLNSTRVFNSNSPEVVQSEGVLLSTFPPKGMKFPAAHLNYPLDGDFSIFFHHISNGVVTKTNKTIFIGLIAHNPNARNAVLKINRAAKYLSQPDASFKVFPPFLESAQGDVFAGPGDRVMSDFVHSKPNESIWPATIVIPPNQSRMIAALPIPVKGLVPPLNGLSGMIELHSSQPVYLASLALYSKSDLDGLDVVPELADWDSALHNDDLVHPREKAPTAPGIKNGIVYGRVAGVSIGNTWEGLVTDASNAKNLSIKPGVKISYPISSIEQGAFGSGQIQSANMAVRYPDTAHQSHGNYGVHYALQIPLHNTGDMEAVVTVHLQTPLKNDESKNELRFFESPPTKVFYRGTVRVRYVDDNNQNCDKYIHLVQNRGERSGPLAQFLMKAGEHRKLQLDLYYPPDATPPQVLTIKASPLVY